MDVLAFKSLRFNACAGVFNLASARLVTCLLVLSAVLPRYANAQGIPTIGSPPSPFSTTFGIGVAATAQQASSTDDAWLYDLELPEFPVRLEGRVLDYLRAYRRDERVRNTIRHWLEQEARYGPWIRSILAAQAVPEDLVAVAMIESGFDPFARSRAGAVGMWQFVEATGQEYGLHVDRWADERRDPAQATVAAANYFRHLHDRFGSWNLAFAAYNMGTGALLRSIQRSNSNQYWSITEVESGLPFETTYYVAKVIACAIVMRNRAAFRFDTSDVSPITFEEIQVSGGTSLSRVARAYGIPVTDLRTLNPKLRRDRVPPGPETLVRIPRQNTSSASEPLGDMGADAVRSIGFRLGETLSLIAGRFGTSAEELRRLNHLARGEQPAPGEAFLVPNRTAREGSAGRVLAPVSEVTKPPNTAQRFFVTTGNESLGTIATAFRVNRQALADWNQLEPTATLPAGMVLQVFVASGFDASRVLARRPEAMLQVPARSPAFYDLREAEEGRVRLLYRVRSGDTLGGLSSRYGLSVGSICRINQIAERTPLQIDQTLVLYIPRDQATEAQRSAFDSRVQGHRRRLLPPTQD